MATATQIKKFIAEIAPLIQKYAKAKGYHVASAIIAQACLESAYGTSSLAAKYHNYFGLKCGGSWKGKSVNMTTKEEYTVGNLTTIKDNFRVYNNMEEGVKGYFDFIGYSRYANLKSAKTAEEYLTLIKQDGYATSSTYVKNNMNLVTKYNLIQYDNFSATPKPTQNSAPTAAPTQSSGATASKEVKASGTARHMNKAFAGSYEVTASMLNIRDKASSANGVKVLTAIPKKTVVKNYGYYSMDGNVTWLYIQTTYKGVTYTGFCSKAYLKKV